VRPNTLYVQALAGVPARFNTLPKKTLAAFAITGKVATAAAHRPAANAEDVIEEFRREGVDE